MLCGKQDKNSNLALTTFAQLSLEKKRENDFK